MSNRGKYGKWEEEMMERVLLAYRTGDMGPNCEARTSQYDESNPKDANCWDKHECCRT